MDNLIHTQSLSKHYEGFDLNDIDLRVPKGMVVGLIGSNGAGKTTLIESLLGLTIPDKGVVDLFGQQVLNGRVCDDRALASLKQRIGVVFDACSFPSEIRVRDVSTMMRAVYNNWNEQLYQTYLQEFKLERGKRIKELSRGMGMKLTLACALSHNPELLILDEATAGLDPLARDEVLDVFQRFMEDENHGILMSSHITTDLEKIADFIICIDKGQLVFSLEKDLITNQAGVAHCRTAEFEKVVADGFFESGMLRYTKQSMGVLILVPNRFEFHQAYQDLVVERATIDEYMNLMLKGEIQ